MEHHWSQRINAVLWGADITMIEQSKQTYSLLCVTLYLIWLYSWPEFTNYTGCSDCLPQPHNFPKSCRPQFGKWIHNRQEMTDGLWIMNREEPGPRPFIRLWIWLIKCTHSYTPRFNDVERGNTVSHCPSVRLWSESCPLCILNKLDPFHVCTSYQATSEGVRRVMIVSIFKN